MQYGGGGYVFFFYGGRGDTRSGRAEALELPQMVERNQDAKCTAFTVSVDLHVSKGITTVYIPYWLWRLLFLAPLSLRSGLALSVSAVAVGPLASLAPASLACLCFVLLCLCLALTPYYSLSLPATLARSVSLSVFVSLLWYSY